MSRNMVPMGTQQKNRKDILRNTLTRLHAELTASLHTLAANHPFAHFRVSPAATVVNQHQPTASLDADYLLPTQLNTGRPTMAFGEDLYEELNNRPPRVFGEDHEEELNQRPPTFFGVDRNEELNQWPPRVFGEDRNKELNQRPPRVFGEDHEEELNQRPHTFFGVDRNEELNQMPPRVFGKGHEEELNQRPHTFFGVDRNEELNQRPPRVYGEDHEEELNQMPPTFFGVDPNEELNQRPPRVFGEDHEEELNQRPPTFFGVDPNEELNQRPSRVFGEDHEEELNQMPHMFVGVDRNEELNQRPPRVFGEDHEEELNQRPHTFFGVDRNEELNQRPPRAFGEDHEEELNQRPPTFFGVDRNEELNQRPPRVFGEDDEEELNQRPPTFFGVDLNEELNQGPSRVFGEDRNEELNQTPPKVFGVDPNKKLNQRPPRAFGVDRNEELDQRPLRVFGVDRNEELNQRPPRVFGVDRNEELNQRPPRVFGEHHEEQLNQRPPTFFGVDRNEELNQRPPRVFGVDPNEELNQRPPRVFGVDPNEELNQRPPRVFGVDPNEELNQRPPTFFRVDRNEELNQGPRRFFGEDRNEELNQRPPRVFGVDRNEELNQRPPKVFGVDLNEELNQKPPRVFGVDRNEELNQRPPRVFGVDRNEELNQRPPRVFGVDRNEELNQRPPRVFGEVHAEELNQRPPTFCGVDRNEELNQRPLRVFGVDRNEELNRRPPRVFGENHEEELNQRPPRFFAADHNEELNQIFQDLGEQVADDDVQEVVEIEEAVADDDVQEVVEIEEAVADNGLVYPLMEMFPEACPTFIRNMCMGKVNDPVVLDNLISRILELKSYPKRQKAASPRQLNSEEQLEILKQVLPDADPKYLQIHCDRLIDRPNELKLFIEQAIEHRNYPTMKDYLRKQQVSAQQKQYTKEFNLKKFLEVIPNPADYFNDPKRKPAKIDVDSQHYALCFLRNHFNRLRVRDIQDVFRKQQKNFLLTCKTLEAVSKSEYMKSTRVATSMPSAIQNIPLLQEIAYYKHRLEIEAFLKQQKEAEANERKTAKQAGLLQTCSCCYDEEVMPQEIYTCENGCVFCKDCARRGAEVAFGDGKLDFACLNHCASHFSLQTLQAVLQPKMFSKVALKKQLEEVKAAGIEDLEMCPFCDFASIPAREDKLFRCFNPECMKESCRLCKEPSHVPLRCEEVEKDDDVKRRTYIENKMTEALLRKCYKCGMKFIKADGCNKMTCTCGALMCYVCEQPVQDYKHFNGPGGDKTNLCPLYSDTNQLHQEAVLKGADEAKQEIGVTDPAQLKFDPTADIQQHYKQFAEKNPPPPHAHIVHVDPFQNLDPGMQQMQERALQRLEEIRNHRQQQLNQPHQH